MFCKKQKNNKKVQVAEMKIYLNWKDTLTLLRNFFFF